MLSLTPKINSLYVVHPFTVEKDKLEGGNFSPRLKFQQFIIMSVLLQ